VRTTGTVAVAASSNINNVDYDNLATSSEVNNVLNMSTPGVGTGTGAGSRNITPRDNSGANNAIGAAIAAGMNLNIQAATSPMSAANLLETGMLNRKLGRRLSGKGSGSGSPRSPRRSSSDRSASPRGRGSGSPRIVEVENENAVAENAVANPVDVTPIVEVVVDSNTHPVVVVPVPVVVPNTLLSVSMVSSIVGTAISNQSAVSGASGSVVAVVAVVPKPTSSRPISQSQSPVHEPENESAQDGRDTQDGQASE